VLIQRSTEEVGSAQRFDYWRDAISDAFVDLDPRRERDQGAFAGRIDGGEIGDVRLCTVRASTHEVFRAPALIRRRGGDFLFVSMLQQGNIVYAQDGRVAELQRPGEIVLYDSAKPYRVAFRADSRQLVLRVPREQLTTRLRRVDTVTALTVDGREGVAALACDLLQTLSGRLHDVDPAVTSPLLDNILDVLAAALAHDRQHDGPDEHRGVHRQRAHDCIRRRFSEAGLTPGQIAHDIGVSERYLYALFQDEGTSPAKALMTERLARAHTLLAQSTMPAGTVEGLALRLGFKQAAHFTRAFKERYGLPPGQYREQALGDPTRIHAARA